MIKEFSEKTKEIAIEVARQKHGNSFDYEVRKGTRVDLTKLNKGEYVCASVIKGYHIFMKPKRV